jgi:uncharacterized protein
MSDDHTSSPEKIEDIPLFPLDAVLFPGTVQPLHIFEDRYKEMIRFCLDNTKPFGVVWDQPGIGETLEGLAVIGTSAAIVHVEPLDEGRMNILAVGKSRFRLLAVFHDQPYLMGQVQSYPFRVEQQVRAAALEARLREYFRAYAPVLAEATGVELRLGDWPDGAPAAAVVAAIALQVPLDDKQRLLAQPTIDQLLAAEIAMFRREQVLLQHMGHLLAEPERLERITTGPFSHN